MQRKNYLYQLDGLRGIACCIIAFLWHYLNMQPKDKGMPFQDILSPFYNHGQYVVELFFVLSGFVMALGYYDKIISARISFKDYIIKRIVHLYPIVLYTFLLTAVLQYAYHFVTGEYYVYQCDISSFILSLLMIQTGWFNTSMPFNGPAWCISVEIFCYIIFYGVAWSSYHLGKNQKTVYNVLLFTILIFWTSVIFMGAGMPFLNGFMARGVSSFFVGCLCFEIYCYIDKCVIKKYTLMILFVLFFHTLVTRYLFGWRFLDNEVQFFTMLIISPIILLLIVSMESLRKLFSIGPLVKLGKISLEIYLCHISVQIIFKLIDACFDLRLNYGAIHIWCLYVVAVLCISTIVHRFIINVKFDILKTFFTYAILSVLMLGIIKMCGFSLEYIYNANYNQPVNDLKLYDGETLSLEFITNQNTRLRNLELYIATWNQKFTDDECLLVKIADEENILGEKRVQLNRIKDGSIYKVDLDDIVLQSGDYKLLLSTNVPKGKPTVAILRTSNAVIAGEGKVTFNGKEENLHPQMVLTGKVEHDDK